MRHRTNGVLAVLGGVLAGLPAGDAFAQSDEDIVQRFEALKKLAGAWHGPDGDGDGAPDSKVVYRVTSAGSTVHATMFPGEAHEMVNTINVAGGEMHFTHYCAMGNQPRMKLAPNENAGAGRDAEAGEDGAPGDANQRWHFSFAGGTNVDPETDRYMGEVVIEVDGDEMTETWTTYNAGETEGTAVFEYTRAPAAPSEGATYYLVLLEHGPERSQNDDEAAEIQKAHLEHLRRLSEEGRLMIAGPFADASGGVLVMRGDSAEAVQRLADRDPAVRAGRLVARVRPWWVPSGSVAHWAEAEGRSR